MSDNQKKHLTEVVEFQDFLNPDRRNVYYEKYDIDLDTFENLVADFNPEEDVILCLGKDRKTLDAFCNEAYGLDFHDTYIKLSGIAKALTRRVYNKLARAGNPTAMNIQQTYLKLAQDYADAKPINIVVDIGGPSHTLVQGNKEKSEC